VVTINIIILLL